MYLSMVQKSQEDEYPILVNTDTLSRVERFDEGHIHLSFVDGGSRVVVGTIEQFKDVLSGRITVIPRERFYIDAHKG